jgi:hypothetical protein
VRLIVLVSSSRALFGVTPRLSHTILLMKVLSGGQNSIGTGTACQCIIFRGLLVSFSFSVVFQFSCLPRLSLFQIASTVNLSPCSLELGHALLIIHNRDLFDFACNTELVLDHIPVCIDMAATGEEEG